MQNTTQTSKARKPKMRLVTVSDQRAEPVATETNANIVKLFVLDMPWKLTSLGLEPEPGQPSHMLPVYDNEADAVAQQKSLEAIGKKADIKVVRYVR